MARRLVILALALAGAAVWSSGALAAVRPAPGPETLATENFEVHFTGDSALDHRATYQVAGDTAAIAQRVYDSLAAWGFPLPLDDGDGRVDIWITEVCTCTNAVALAHPDDPTAAQTSGWIELDRSVARSERVIAHEIFHLVQFATWLPMSPWLLEATADWASYRFVGFPAVPDEALGPPDLSLDCAGDGCGDVHEARGYSRWPFFQYATERFGSAFVQEVLARGAAVGNPAVSARDLLDQVLTARGTSLSQVYADFSVATLAGALEAPSLRARLPRLFTRVQTGTQSGSLPTLRIAVNHLATRYVAFERGPAAGACHAATLRLTVALPAGVGAVPHFFWTGGGGTATPFAVSGSSATLSVPWDTCTWEGRYGVVSLANASHDLDARTFTVTGTITVDRTRIATATPPPPGWLTGTTVAVPLAEPAPQIAVYGPSLLAVAPRDATVRLVVFSSGPGKLETTFAGRAAGTFSLRSGNNVVRVRIPASVARRTLAHGTRLQLTSVAPSGIVFGATVSRTVRLLRGR